MDKRKKTAIEQIQEQIERQMFPLRQFEEMQNQVKRYSEYYQVEELARQYEPHRKIREILERSVIPKHIQDIIDGTSMNTQYAQAKRMMEQSIPTNALAHIGINYDTFRGATGIIESIRLAAGLDFKSDFALKFVESNSAFRAMEEAQKLLNTLLPTFLDTDFEQFETSEKDEQELKQAVNSITLAVTKEESIQKVVERIVNTIQAQHEPKVQLMLWVIFCKVIDWLISGAIGAAMGYYTPVILGESPQAAKKAILENARTVVGSTQILADYRYVSAKILIVRQNPKARSREIGHLSIGKVVKLLKKENDFALVMWNDEESDAEIQGWVFSRYLGKFN